MICYCAINNKTFKRMNPIYFCSHRESAYDNDTFRYIFSQWYQSEKGFIGGNALYSLQECIREDDYDVYVVGKQFKLREQWMMCLKALLFAQNDVYRKCNLKIVKGIMETTEPSAIKNFGRQIKGFDEIVWNKYKYAIVANGNYLEFSQNEHMKNILLATNQREIIEAAHYDSVWGIGFNEKDALKTDRNLWGQNLLGKAIMEVREVLSR